MSHRTMGDSWLIVVSFMVKIKRVAPGVYDVLGVENDELSIEKRYGEWRIIDEHESFSPLGWATLREATKYLLSYLKRKGKL